jgi:ubiquinol-cytochrome c reductase iron-sulfur subunit
MSSEGVDQKRRRFLTAATTVVGGVGAAFAAVPFLASFQPSAKAQAIGAPVEVDIGKLEPGQMITVRWRGKPVWVVYRTKEMLDALPGLNEQLRDPESTNPEQQPKYAANATRSLKPPIVILVGICTHLGCSPTFRPEFSPADLGPDWRGGFFCPCHGSRFDLAGRVFQGVPAPVNLEVPPHAYLSDTRLVIGIDEGVA